MVGLGMVVIAGMLLWYRRELYWAYQWIVRYPQNGIVHVVVQIATPMAAIIAGVALILWPVVRW